MRFSKSVIYFLNWNSFAKRIAFLFLYPWTIHIQNDFLILLGKESLKNQW